MGTWTRVVVVAAVAASVAVMDAGRAWALEIEDARPLAFGGALRANCPSNSALFLNPAGLAIGRLYHVETLYTFVPTANGHLAGGSVVDSVTAPVAAGLAFSYFAWDPEGLNRSEYDVRLAFAYYLANIVSFGLTVKYMYADQDGPGPLGQSLLRSTDDPLLNTVSVDVGMIFTIGRIFNIGVVGYNLTDTGSIHAPLSLGLGFSLALGSSFVLAGDTLFDFRSREEPLTMRYMAGAEYFIANHFPVRLGYRYDELLETHSVTAGVGYIARQFATELSVRQDVYGEELHTWIALTVRYFAN